jgi:hypothetical protein
MIYVTHTSRATLERDTFVHATSVHREPDGIGGQLTVLRDPLHRIVASFDPVKVVAMHRREGVNGPLTTLPLGGAL